MVLPSTGHWLADAGMRVSIAVFLAGLFQQTLLHASDPYRCGALTRHGSWPPYTPPSAPEALEYEQLADLSRQGLDVPPRRPFDKWEPAGCRMHEYAREDMSACLGGQRILFIGDATARVLFFAALTRLDHEAAEWLLRSTMTEADPRHDLAIESESVVLDFLWDPWLNSSMLAELHDLDLDGLPRAGLTIVGANGHWAAQHAGDAYLDEFQRATDTVAQAMTNPVRPFLDDHTTPASDYVFLAPPTVPRYEQLMPDVERALSPKRIGSMSAVLDRLPPAAQSHVLHAYTDMVRGVPDAYDETGLHVSAAVAERWIDVPLNARCNQLLARTAGANLQGPAFEATCCVARPRLLGVQRLVLVGLVAAALVPIVFFLPRRREAARFFYAAATVSAAALFCYLADRTQLLPQAEVHTTSLSLLVLVAAAAAALASVRTAPLAPGDVPGDVSKHHGFLPRHVSDEWKGVMQAVSVWAAWHGATDSPLLANWAEFAANASLFLSAFGHASHLLTTGRCTLGRIAAVLFRINLVPCLLALLLDGRASGTAASVAHLYSFSRLASFWFVATCITIGPAVRRQRNCPGTLLLRVLAAGLVIALLVLAPRKYDPIALASRVSAKLARSTWEPAAARAAIQAAWCAPLAGMAMAVVAHRVRSIRSRTTLACSLPSATTSKADRPAVHDAMHDAVHDSFTGKNASWVDRRVVSVIYPTEHTEPLQAVIHVLAFVGFSWHVLLTVVVPPPSKDDDVHNVHYPVSTCLAVVCFAIVRTCHDRLASAYLALPARAGRLALELYVLHRHILLAGNGTGRLRLFSSQATLGGLLPAAETASLAAVCMAVCWHTHTSTRALADAIFKQNGPARPSDESGIASDPLGQTHPDRNTDRRSGWSDAWTADTRVRTAALVLVFWLLNRLYV